MTKLVLNEVLEEVGSNAFNDTGIKSLNLPGSLKKIGKESFSSNVKLDSVVIADGVNELPERMFKDCAALKKVEVPDSVEKINTLAFEDCADLKDYSGLSLGAGSCFTVKEGMLLDKTGTKLLAYPCMVNTADDGEKVTLPDYISEIGSNAFNSSVSMIYVPDSVKKTDDYAMGYLYQGSEEKSLGTDSVNTELIIITSSKPVIEYAKERNINVVSEIDPDYIMENGRPKVESYCEDESKNVKKITLKAGETREMKVKGIETNAYYSSSDKKIASVDNKGVITAMANGTTTIILTTGSLHLCLEVTVTGGQDPVYDDDLTVFKNDDEESVAAWEHLYTEYNSRLWFSLVDFPAVNVYSSNVYNSVTAPYYGKNSPTYQTFITNIYGKGCGEYFNTISENLENEIATSKLDQDLLLFSGKGGKYGVDYVTADHGMSMKSLVDSIGKQTTYTNVISTSLYHRVADEFSDKPWGAIFEIEGRADKVNGMLIRDFSEFSEEIEFLLNHGIRFKIVDAGVRRFVNGTVNETGKESYGVKPYLRMQIVS